jgi:hypothetical protein
LGRSANDVFAKDDCFGRSGAQPKGKDQNNGCGQLLQNSPLVKARYLGA